MSEPTDAREFLESEIEEFSSECNPAWAEKLVDLLTRFAAHCAAPLEARIKELEAERPSRTIDGKFSTGRGVGAIQGDTMNCKKCGTSLIDAERTAKYGTSTFLPKCPKCGEKIDLRKLMELAAGKGKR